MNIQAFAHVSTLPIDIIPGQVDRDALYKYMPTRT